MSAVRRVGPAQAPFRWRSRWPAYNLADFSADADFEQTPGGPPDAPVLLTLGLLLFTSRRRSGGQDQTVVRRKGQFHHHLLVLLQLSPSQRKMAEVILL